MLRRIIPFLFVVVSASVFAQTTLTITSPSFGEEWGISTTNNITWTSENYSGTIDIVLVNGGDSSETIIATGEADDGNYSWKVPASLSPGTYVLTISDNKDAPTVSTDVQFSITRQIWLSGTMNSYGGDAMTYREVIMSDASWIYTYQENGSADVEFKFRDNTDNWTQGNWGRADVVSMSGLTTWYNNGANGKFTPNASSYYTFIHKDVDNGVDSEGFVFETAATPVSLLAVEHTPLFVTPTDNVIVSVTTSAAPSAGEKAYVIYTIDGGANFEFAEAAFVGSVGAAIIPTQVAGTRVLYFPITTGNIADMTTVDWEQAYIDILIDGNNGGAYGYTVYEPVDIVINEVDSDTPGTEDALEFIELFDSGVGSTTLDGLVVVFYDGSEDKVYQSYDLDGYNTSLTGYFVLGSPSVANFNYGIPNNTILNGGDAVALYYGDDTDFPIGGSLKTENLIDAFVYGSSADPGLLVLLNAAQQQVDENSDFDSENVSSQRIINGTGGTRNTVSYQQAAPTPGTINIGETNWTGDFDTNFSDIRNWSNGLPTSDYSIYIPADLTYYPIISAGVIANANSLEIAAGAEFTIEATGTLNVNNPVLIQSNETKSGSLINFGSLLNSSSKKNSKGSSVSDIIYNRFIIGNQWHMLGSPLTGQEINSTFITNNAIIGMKDYNESESPSAWSTDYTTTLPNADLSLGKGYAIKNSTSGTISLEGIPNSVTKNIALSHEKYGWNLLSNPFTSAIAANNIADAANNLITVNTNVLDGSYVGLYIWDQSTSSYEVLNHSGGTVGQDYLQVGQGFFVKSDDPAGTFSISPAMQSHQPSVAFKSSKEESWSNIILSLETNDAKSSTQISYQEMMTRGLDIGYDAGLFGGNSNLAIYSRLVEDNGVDFGLQCLPPDYENLIIPLGVNAKESDIISFSVSATNIPEDYALILEDKWLGEYIDLSDENEKYTILLSDDLDGLGRFYLHTRFKDALSLDALGTESNVQVFSRADLNQIVIRGEFSSNAMARIYSIAGKLLAIINLSQAVENMVPFKEETGVYIIQITDAEKTITRKLSWVNQ